MSDGTRRVAPALLAALLAALAMTAAAVRAEPAAAPAASDDCLAKPNAPAPPGSHWYYHVDRASGRQCWHLKDAKIDTKIDTKTDTKANTNTDAKVDQGARAAAPAAAAPAVAPSAPAAPPSVQAAPGALVGSGAQSIVPAIGAVPPLPAEWPRATATPSQAAAPVAGSAADQVPPTPAVEPNAQSNVEPRNADPDAASASGSAQPVTPGAPAAEPATASAADSSHLPALLGIALALGLIVLGSFAGRLAAPQLRGPRRRVLLDVPQASPDAQARDITAVDAHAALRVRRHEWETDPQPESHDESVAEPTREAARVLEDNVRELLHRLQAELTAGTSGLEGLAAPAAHAPQPVAPTVRSPSLAPGDLEATLALWRARKR